MPHLDHIIVLIPYASLLSPPTWLTTNFTITPGGRHADHKTENKLICFADGSYIELISFIKDDPALREGHWWGKKEFGIIDFAFTSASNASENYEDVKGRLGRVEWEEGEEGLRYQKPLAGGRKRDDGVDVKWEVTFPDVEGGCQRGELPFFCHDVTERGLRVPFSEGSTRHPSKVLSVRRLGVYVPRKRVGTLKKAYDAVLGVESNEEGVFETVPLKGRGGNVGFKVGEPREDGGRQEMERRGGLFLGDLVFAKEGKDDGLTRIDGNGSEFGMGHWSL